MSQLGYIKQKPKTSYGRRPFNPLGLILALVLFISLSFFIYKYHAELLLFVNKIRIHTDKKSISGSDITTASEAVNIDTDTVTDTIITELFSGAERLALSYDYDKAIELLSASDMSTDQRIQDKIAEYESVKSTLIRQDIYTIPHIFFHTLIVDTSKAFDGDRKEIGYNQVMTTMDEFEKILENLYAKGFVLVSLHDMAYEVLDEESGNTKMVEGDILLPEGKKAIVMSQDDVCYYEYMVGDGFASRLVLDTNGRVTTEMDLADGSSIIGDYDLIPVLNRFIEKHPDFSYRGAKAVIALTGYNGILGYRTDASYEDINENIEADRQKAREIADALRADGFELASHSWGHRYLGHISFADFKADSDRWDSNVKPLIGDTDIILFPFGADIGDWHPYSETNDRYQYLRSLGFRYFCNVDSRTYWVQLGEDYFRQGRRNLDGYRMWRDITEPDNQKLNDLFDAGEVFDKARPTPVDALN